MPPNLPPLLAACLTLAIAFTHSHSSDGNSAIGSFTDARDGKNYKTVKIGEQTWMAENLNYKANGSLCYNHNESYCEKYGRLYNWDEAMKVCPDEWHLPTSSDWYNLTQIAGDRYIAYSKLRARSDWTDSIRYKATDDFSFSALPGGFRCADSSYVKSVGGRFINIGNNGVWWSATVNKYGIPLYRYMSQLTTAFSEGYQLMSPNDNINEISFHKSMRFSVRCVKD
jgi:uncharacterized protein (TIGR02145 family)